VMEQALLILTAGAWIILTMNMQGKYFSIVHEWNSKSEKWNNIIKY
jgi:hypothetical protein